MGVILHVEIDPENRVHIRADDRKDDSAVQTVMAMLSPVLRAALPKIIEQHGRVKPEHLQPFFEAMSPLLGANGFTEVQMRHAPTLTMQVKPSPDAAKQLRELADLLDLGRRVAGEPDPV